MAKKRNGGLGRGLAALIPTDDRPAGPRATSPTAP